MNRSSGTIETVLPLVSATTLITVTVLLGLLMLVFGGPIGIATVIAVGLTVWRAMRVTRQQAFMAMLAEAIERRIPLIPALEAFGEEYWLWSGRTRRLAVALARGITLGEGLRLFPGLVPAESLPLVEAGHRTGRLGESLRRAAEQSDRTGPLWQALAGKTFYLAMLVAFMALIWTFVSIRIMPSFVHIFQDFDCQLPWLTRQMIGVSNLLYQASPLVVLAGLFLVGLGIYGALCYVGLITCDLPGTRWAARRLDTANVLDSLALSIEAAQTLPEALASLAAYYPKRSIRGRLRRVWIMVADGQDWCEGLVLAGLLRPADAGVIRSAARADNLPWAMREMADSSRRRFAYRMHVVLQVVFPVLLVGIGLAVCLYATACFLPLVQLIERLV